MGKKPAAKVGDKKGTKGAAAVAAPAKVRRAHASVCFVRFAVAKWRRRCQPVVFLRAVPTAPVLDFPIGKFFFLSKGKYSLHFFSVASPLARSLFQRPPPFLPLTPLSPSPRIIRPPRAPAPSGRRR